jgi:hypothetical protein
MQDDDERDELFEEIERRALFEMEDEEQTEPLDVVETLRDGNGNGTPVQAQDITLGGYQEKHVRAAAFEGADGQPYTVDVDTEEQEDGRWAGFLVFIRWAATGAGIMDHVESPDVASGASEEEARNAVLELSLYEVKAELDAAIGRREGEAAQ